MPSRRTLLRHLWAMVQTRAEAAALVVQLQRTAVTQGLLYAAIAAVAALSFSTAVIVWIAVAAPEAWRSWALGLVALALLATAVYSVVAAGRRVRHDRDLIADFTRGLRLDLAMVNLALKDADTEDEDKLAERERAKSAVREAAKDKAATPSTAEGGTVAPEGPAMESAAAAFRAARPRPDAERATTTVGSEVASSPGPSASAATTGPSPAGPSGPAVSDTIPKSPATAVAGGAYVSNSATSQDAETEREMPGPVLGAGRAGPSEDSTERRRGHGSA